MGTAVSVAVSLLLVVLIAGIWFFTEGGDLFAIRYYVRVRAVRVDRSPSAVMKWLALHVVSPPRYKW
jgi:hypothetical protein